jgi:hypothetical protein
MSINAGRWSDPFSLEAVGTTGMIQCKDDNRTYNVINSIHFCFMIFSNLNIQSLFDLVLDESDNE